MTRHLILGSGPAALNAIETIRSLDNGASTITLVGDEPAYARMVLPYWLAGRVPEKQIYTGDAAYFDRLKVECRFGRRATAIDPAAKSVTLDDGAVLSFDDLLIATGSSPLVPPIPGATLPGVHPLWTLANTEAVLKDAEGKERPEVVFVGAGFIGFIVLNALFKRGWKLHVVEMAGQVLPRMLDADAAGLVQTWLQNRGVALHLGTTVQSIAGADGRKRVHLADGRTIDADLVILATGVRPNASVTAGSGISVREGILVNDRMQTSFPHIYAAGDVAQGPDLLGGEPTVHAIQPTAVDHGRVAGANMAGREVHYPGSLLMNILDACGLQCASFGRWGEATEAMTIRNPDRPVYRKLLWTGDQVTGAVFLGPANDLGMLNDLGMVKGIIQTRARLGAWKEYLRANPFDIRRAYVAARVGQQLVQTTLLGMPARPRQYRMDGLEAGPQVTEPEAHRMYVETKE